MGVLHMVWYLGEYLRNAKINAKLLLDSSHFQSQVSLALIPHNICSSNHGSQAGTCSRVGWGWGVGGGVRSLVNLEAALIILSEGISVCFT